MGREGKWEVEQKFTVQAADALRERLARLGFAEWRRGDQSDRYFRHPCRDFRQTGEAFRVRRDADRCVVTYKGPRTEATVKTRPEIELHIDSQEVHEWEDMFSRLGFKALPPIEKRRIAYRATGTHEWADVVVVLDEVAGLGCFAEIECVVNSAADTLRAQQTVQELAQRLGLSQIERRSYLSMALSAWGIE
ncbi:MAG: class IV adenylate cyclase [Planctomycetota bacterium]|nr:MAG: class IV adenylate cyclase [Planctomycetota bacterium]